MPYTKIIRAGLEVEEWEYERLPIMERNINRRTGRRIVSNVRRADNIRKCRTSFRRLVSSNLNTATPPILVTLTFAGIVDISQGYTEYTAFIERLRYRFGSVFSAIAVPEFQKRGSVHFHVLVFNMGYDPKEERRSRVIADLWGHGFVDVVPTDGSPKLARYLAKYMSKAMHDIRLSGKRAYSATRNVLRPVCLNRLKEIAWAKLDWGLGGDNPPYKVRDYDTMFLGRCVYKQFLIS